MPAEARNAPYIRTQTRHAERTRPPRASKNAAVRNAPHHSAAHSSPESRPTAPEASARPLCALFLFSAGHAFDVLRFKRLCVPGVPKRIVRREHDFTLVRHAVIVLRPEAIRKEIHLPGYHQFCVKSLQKILRFFNDKRRFAAKSLVFPMFPIKQGGDRITGRHRHFLDRGYLTARAATLKVVIQTRRKLLIAPDSGALVIGEDLADAVRASGLSADEIYILASRTTAKIAKERGLV